jgi:hypothetical protein
MIKDIEDEDEKQPDREKKAPRNDDISHDQIDKQLYKYSAAKIAA